MALPSNTPNNREIRGNASAVGSRIYLSPPHLSGDEQAFVLEALASNWVAPAGPHIEAFEREFCDVVGASHGAAVSSGTAALHLSLILSGVGPGDEVLVSTLTFAASVNPILYVGANPVFIGSERRSWNLDPELLADAIEVRVRAGRTPKAVIVVHLYGQAANLDPVLELCRRHEIAVIEDAAEALGATYGERSPGTFGQFGVFSFNGNKIITTGGGGMLVSADESMIVHARKLASQARDQAPHYQHSEIGYNYRLSNVLAGIGRAQLRVLDERVRRRREIFEFYRRSLEDLPGIDFMPEADWGRHTRWLTTLTLSESAFGATSRDVLDALERDNIEARPIWKPMHKQPVFSRYQAHGGAVSEDLFDRGLCLPSGSNLEQGDLDRVVASIRACHR